MESPSERSIIREPLLGNGNGPPKGGLRTIPFIVANEAFEKAANYGLMPNMILYLMQGYGFEVVTGTNLIYFWNAATNFTPVIGAFLADAYVGRYFMIAFGSITCLLGMFLLWMTTIIPGALPCNLSGSQCTSVNVYQLTLLISSFGLMAVGSGGIRSSSLAFGADQLVKGDSVGNAGILEKFVSWYYFCCTVGVVIAMTFLVYIQDHFGWRIGFGVPGMLMVLSAISFFLATSFYANQKATASSLVALTQVLVASWKKRHLVLSSERADMLSYHTMGTGLIIPSEKLRFLNKACIISCAKAELAPDGASLDPWCLCTVDQVEELKALMKVMPMWSAGIMISVTVGNNSWPTLLAKSMDRHLTSSFEVPAGSFATFSIAFLVVWIVLYEGIIMPVAAKIRGKPTRLSVRTRMGLGALLSVFAVATQGIVESFRRKTAIEEGFSDNPEAVVHMSAWWLLIQSFLGGGALAFSSIGQNEFFLSEFPKSMSSVATNLFGVGMSVASVVSSLIMSSVDSITKKNGKESWVASNINKAHFDYYCWLLAGLGLLNFIYYIICNRAYGPSQSEEAALGDAEEISDE